MMTQLTKLITIALGFLLLASNEGMATAAVSGNLGCLASRGDRCIVECREETDEECSLVLCRYPEGFRNGGSNRLDFSTYAGFLAANTTSAAIFADICEDIYDEFTDRSLTIQSLEDLLATNNEERSYWRDVAWEKTVAASRLEGELNAQRRVRQRLGNSVAQVCRLTSEIQCPSRENHVLCRIGEAVAEHCPSGIKATAGVPTSSSVRVDKIEPKRSK